MNNGETFEQIYDKYVCCINLDGLTFDRVTDIAKHLNTSLRSLTGRIEKGMSCLEAVQEEKEIEKTTILTGLKKATICASLAKGETHEFLRKLHCINYEYKGEIYTTLKSLTEKLRLSLPQTTACIKDHDNLDELVYLASPITYEDIDYSDHKELVRVKGEVSYIIYTKNLKKGYSIEKALSRKYRESSSDELTETINLTGLSRNLVNINLRKGYSHEDVRKKYCINFEYDGTVYTNLRALADRLNISLQVISRAVSEGTDLDMIVYLASAIAHKGTIYASHKELVEKVGKIRYSYYLEKLKKGFSIEEALDNKKKKRDRFFYGVSMLRIIEVHDISIYLFYKNFDNFENYILEVVLWKNFNFLGFTEDNKVVYRKTETEIVYTSFEEYINYLEENGYVKN